jgi:hypothetical protein
MNKYETHTYRLREELRKISTVEKAASSRRYFPNGIVCIGATASDIKTIITAFQSNNSELTATEVLSIA